MISYAQNAEDVVLERVFSDYVTPGFYIDIGACDPIADSVTLHFYEKGWHGINVEPDPNLFRSFLSHRERDTNINAALDLTAGAIDFFPTFVRGHGTVHPGYAASRAVASTPIRIPTVTLSGLIEQHLIGDRDIDFLKIDVEGWERQVIGGMDWSRYRPKVVVVEAVDDVGRPTHEEWEAHLSSGGYQFALRDGLNRFYCRDEDAKHLMPRLSAPANVLDNWIRASEAQAISALAAAALRANEMSDALREANRAKDAALEAVGSKAAELARAQEEMARAFERERIAEVALAEFEIRAQMKREIKAHKDERALIPRMRNFTGLFRRTFRGE